ncbi:uncharacterized protein BKA55DRAFT_680756 [Fusarium redolens]|uniref:Fe2OG dioxygenase domain-containing protein n=1 Tax=Fusarium redolens TaxID=48865 RepID=A0A9P9JRH8_FUSRE|nr:uncharacterized protein BKA55DRAFT_680756 [Fusarium redolens]KAH7227098.1 hypothetical protein BKA55DRAFT_680756 [Fusarium redolens]
MPSVYTLNHGDAEKERHRLDFQHGVFKAIMRDDLPPVIWQHLKSLPAPKVADADTGTGIFLKELAPKLAKEAQLDGFDIDTRKFYGPASLPAMSSCSTLLYAALKKDEWLQAVKNLKTLLKPDGYLFWSEIGAYGYASNPYSATFHEWKSIESVAAVKYLRTALRYHTDIGVITVLANVLGGLQVLEPGKATTDPGAWHWVRPQPRKLIINLGDAMVQWTGGLLRSNTHRVTYSSGEQRFVDRYSMAYFMRPEKNASMRRLIGEGDDGDAADLTAG